MSDLLTTDLNYLAILVAGISNMVIGFLWYGPIFGKMWMGLIGKTADELSSNPIDLCCFLLALALDGGRALHLHSPRQREHPIDDTSHRPSRGPACMGWLRRPGDVSEQYVLRDLEAALCD